MLYYLHTMAASWSPRQPVSQHRDNVMTIQDHRNTMSAFARHGGVNRVCDLDQVG